MLSWQEMIITSQLFGVAGIKMGRPEYLWLLWLVPALVVFYLFVFRSRRRLLERFASPELLERIVSGVSVPRQTFKVSLVVLGVGLLVLALTQVKYGFTWEDVERQGVDIIVALDVSDSMLVEDAESGGGISRLERAKREITDLLRILEGDRVGLVAFAGTAFIECPLTLDYAAAEIFLDDLDTDLIPVKGTAVGTAVRTALEAFKKSTHDSKAIILITDGEDHSGEALMAAGEAKIQGVRIFPIGIGRDEGAPIPAPGGGFRKDRRGEVILSKLDETTLQKMALNTGGRYVRSVTGDVDLEKIYVQGIKATLEDQELGSRRRQHWKDRFQWILALCLVVLMIEPLIPERVSSRKKQFGQKLGLFLVFLAFGLPGPSTFASDDTGVEPDLGKAATQAQEPETMSESKTVTYDDPFNAYENGRYGQALEGFVDEQVDHPDDPRVLMNIGSSHYQMKNYDEALGNFAQAGLKGDPELRSRALYNVGNVAFRQGKLEEAIGYYQSVLELNPEDEDAKFNIEFVRNEIRRRHEEAKKRSQEQQQGGQKQENQQQNSDQEKQESQEKGEQEPPSEPPPGEQDTDEDGLSDSTEKEGKNPTDPSNPDSDQDGLLDGQEDTNGNGQVDEGETDPNKVDTDGDGVSDAQEARPPGEQSQALEEAALSPEEAERYLQGLEEDRPKRRHKGGARRRSEKDW